MKKNNTFPNKITTKTEQNIKQLKNPGISGIYELFINKKVVTKYDDTVLFTMSLNKDGTLDKDMLCDALRLCEYQLNGVSRIMHTAAFGPFQSLYTDNRTCGYPFQYYFYETLCEYIQTGKIEYRIIEDADDYLHLHWRFTDNNEDTFLSVVDMKYQIYKAVYEEHHLFKEWRYYHQSEWYHWIESKFGIIVPKEQWEIIKANK